MRKPINKLIIVSTTLTLSIIIWLRLYGFTGFRTLASYGDPNYGDHLKFDYIASKKCALDNFYCTKFSGDDYARKLSVFNLSSKYCEDLVKDWSPYNMSKAYYDLLPSFRARIDMAITEGHSNQVPEEMMVLHYLASTESVRTVCETGFNYGHSSFNFLTSNPDLKVHSFDLGVHEYARKMAVSLPEVLNKSDRLKVRFGDSTVEVPKAISDKSLPLCDLIFVDGGHTYPVAKADILNLARHSSEHNVIIFDDYPTSWGTTFGLAWDELLVDEKQATEMIKQQKQQDNNNNNNNNNKTINSTRVGIVQMVRCTKRKLENNFQRGFVVGRIVLS